MAQLKYWNKLMKKINIIDKEYYRLIAENVKNSLDIKIERK